MLKTSAMVTAETLQQLFNQALTTGEFPSNLKNADVTPVFKKNNPLNKENYRPVSVLPIISKVIEKMMQNQINVHIKSFLSPYLCGYRKGFNIQHALISLIERWRKSLDNKGYGGAVLMDLSKAFDTLNHDLLIAKLHAYGFDIKTLKLLHSFLTKRWQRTKVNSSFSTWSELLQGVPQGSVLGPILFNIYLNDLFYLTEMTQVCNFPDDTTFYVCDKDLNILINRIEHDTSLAVEGFENNFMKLNQDKCHLLVSEHKHETVWAKIGEAEIWESNKQKMLGIVIDRNLNFDEYVFDLCKKAGRKLSVLARLSNYMSFEKRKILLKAFVESQFGYCPLTWMFHGRRATSKINHILERALRIVYKNNLLSFEELLELDKSFKIHHRNIQSLVIELFKIKNNLSVAIMNDIFQPRAVRYNLRPQIDLLGQM